MLPQQSLNTFSTVTTEGHHFKIKKKTKKNAMICGNKIKGRGGGGRTVSPHSQNKKLKMNQQKKSFYQPHKEKRTLIGWSPPKLCLTTIR